MEYSRVSITQVQHTSALVGVSGPVDLLQPHKPTLGMPHIYPLKALLHGTITAILFQDLNCFLSRHGGCLCIMKALGCVHKLASSLPSHTTLPYSILSVHYSISSIQAQ